VIHTSNPLCVALDELEPNANEAMADRLTDVVGMLKLGLTGFVTGGPALVRSLVRRAPLFLDLKFHDIPAQVEGAVRNVASLGVSYTNVHAAGGSRMVKAAVAGGGDEVEVLAVTVLTSLDDSDLAAVGLAGPTETAVLRLAEMALDAGASGLVCSPREVEAVRARFGPSESGGPVLVVPGIRPEGTEAGDHQRVHTPAAALSAGADHIVVGRPITTAPDPGACARRIVEEIS
jgi:orotidine-5'-phosphate decarboxylase